jgi:hypothetical protein
VARTTTAGSQRHNQHEAGCGDEPKPSCPAQFSRRPGITAEAFSFEASPPGIASGAGLRANTQAPMLQYYKARAKLLTSRCRLGEAYRFVGNNSLKAPLMLQRTANTRRRQRRIPMELILIIVVVVLLFGGGGYWGRRRGHW